MEENFSNDSIDYIITKDKLKIEIPLEKLKTTLKSWLDFETNEDLLDSILNMIIINFSYGEWKEPFFKIYEDKLSKENNYM